MGKCKPGSFIFMLGTGNNFKVLVHIVKLGYLVLAVNVLLLLFKYMNEGFPKHRRINAKISKGKMAGSYDRQCGEIEKGNQTCILNVTAAQTSSKLILFSRSMAYDFQT